MAAILNERDWTLQHAATRTIEVEPPAAVIIPGYTGLTITPDNWLTVSTFGRGPYAIPQPGQTFTADRKGIPPEIAVTWDTGQIFQYLTTDPRNAGLTEVPSPSPGFKNGSPLAGYKFYWQAGTSNIILTDTGDPMEKLIRAESYPNGSTGPTGWIRVVATYGGQLFQAFAHAGTFYG